MSVFRRLRKCGEREKKENKLYAKYNGLLALATLERATIITDLFYMNMTQDRVIDNMLQYLKGGAKKRGHLISLQIF